MLNMKSVMVFNPHDSQQETENKWVQWNEFNKRSCVADRAVPNAEETRKYLNQYKREQVI